MKKTFSRIYMLSFSLALIVLIHACKKDNPNNTSQNSTTSYKVKTVIDVYTSGGITTPYDTESYTYDTQGRLITDYSSHYGGTSTYTYNGSIVNAFQFFGSFSFSGDIGSNGLLIDLNGPGQPQFFHTYTYDVTGRLLTDTATINGLVANTSTFTWTDSNLTNVNSINYTQSGSVNNTSTYSYTYLSTKEYRDNGLSSQMYNDYIPGIVAGRNSKNLINTETDVVNGTTTVQNHTYTFDSKGRIATETIGSTSQSDVFSYTYY